MKTKDLIRALQLSDPSGEYEVVIDNVDIKNIQTFHGNDRGWYQNIVADRNEYGGITRYKGAKYIGEGYKVVITPYPLSEVLRSYPSLKIETIGSDPHGYKKQLVESWRPQLIPLDQSVSESNSIVNMIDRLPTLDNFIEDVFDDEDDQ